MSRSLRGLSAAFVLTCALPFGAQAQVSSSSSGSGVQIIDMNAAPAAHKKAAPKPKVSPTPSDLPGAEELLKNAMTYVGSPFKKNGMSPAGFDSAGFTQYAYASIGVRIPRQAPAQFFSGRQIVGDPLPGDLVFFQTIAYGPSEVGIYVGNSQFLTSSGASVHVDSFTSPYYKSRYLGARRYLPG